MIVGFTGTRSSLTNIQITNLSYVLYRLNTTKSGITHVVHGDCVGSDERFDQICYRHGIRRVLYPSDIPDLRAHSEWKRRDRVLAHPAEPPLLRNKKIVAASKILLACPKTLDEQRRSGTWTTVRAARAAEVPIILIYPNGSVAEPSQVNGFYPDTMQPNKPRVCDRCGFNIPGGFQLAHERWCDPNYVEAYPKR